MFIEVCDIEWIYEQKLTEKGEHEKQFAVQFKFCISFFFATDAKQR